MVSCSCFHGVSWALVGKSVIQMIYLLLSTPRHLFYALWPVMSLHSNHHPLHKDGERVIEETWYESGMGATEGENKERGGSGNGRRVGRKMNRSQVCTKVPQQRLLPCMLTVKTHKINLWVTVCGSQCSARAILPAFYQIITTGEWIRFLVISWRNVSYRKIFVVFLGFSGYTWEREGSQDENS